MEGPFFVKLEWWLGAGGFLLSAFFSPLDADLLRQAINEATTINQSLASLQALIQYQSQQEHKAGEVFSYRSNPLTLLLKDVIGGNAKTLMFVNVSPASDSYHETRNSLTWGSKAKQVQNSIEKQVRLYVPSSRSFSSPPPFSLSLFLSFSLSLSLPLSLSSCVSLSLSYPL